MVSFRKIINILVLISYVKMTVLSSFAAEPSTPTPVTTKLKIRPDFRMDGSLSQIQLDLIQKDPTTGEKSILQSRTIHNPNNRFQQDLPAQPDIKWIQENNQVQGFQWHVQGIGTVSVEFNGSVHLIGLNQGDPSEIFKISSSSVILLHNCVMHNLQVKSQALMLMGGNVLHNLISTTDAHGGIVIYQTDHADTLGNITSQGGSILNIAEPVVMDGSVWNMGGGDFSNKNRLHVRGSHQIINGKLLENTGEIQGGNVSFQGQDLINNGQIQSQSVTAQVSGDFVNMKTLSGDEGVTVTVGGTGINSGTITSKDGRVNLQSPNKDFLNSASIDGKAFESDRLDNTGTIQAKRDMTLGSGENRGKIVSGDINDAFISGNFLNLGEFNGAGLSGKGSFINKGQLSVLGLRIKSFADQGGRIVSALLVVSYLCEHFETSPSTTLTVDYLNLISPDSNNARILRGVIESEDMDVSCNLTIAGRVKTQNLITTRNTSPGIPEITRQCAAMTTHIEVSAEGSLAAQDSKLECTQIESAGVVDLGATSLTTSLITNRGTLQVLPIQWSACRPSPIVNLGTLLIQFDHPRLKAGASSYISQIIDNQGTVRIKGSYSPVHSYLVTPKVDAWGGKVIVEGNLHLRAEDLDVFLRSHSNQYTVNLLNIYGYEEQSLTLDNPVDLTFAKETHFYRLPSISLGKNAHLRVNNPEFLNIGSFICQGDMSIPEGDLRMYNIGSFSMGLNNSKLGKIAVVNGGVQATIDRDIDVRYGQIESRKDGVITSMVGKILVGAEGGKEDNYFGIIHTNWLHNPIYTKKYLNGSFIKSFAKLDLRAPTSDILIHYGQVLSSQGLNLSVGNLIENMSGEIFSYGDITLRGKKYLSTRPNQRAFTASSPSPSFSNLVYYFEQADPAMLDTVENLYSYVDSMVIQYSDVIAGKNFFFGGQEQKLSDIHRVLSIESRVTHLTETCDGRINYHHTDRTPVTLSRVKIGQETRVFGAQVSITGSVSSARLMFNLEKFLAENITGYRSQSGLSNDIEIDITQLMKNLLLDPISARFNLGRSCLENDPEEGSSSSSSDDVDDFHRENNPDSTIIRLISQLTGKAYIKKPNGDIVSGRDMIKYLAENGRRLFNDLKNKISALIIGYRQSQQDQSRREKFLKLLISPEDVNPHQNSGDIAGEEIDIKTTDDQSHKNNAVHANKTTVLESEGSFQAENATISGDDGVGVKANTLDAETVAQRIYFNNGYTDIINGEMKFTSKYGPVRLVTLADMVLRGTAVDGASIGVKVGGNRLFETTQLHSEKTERRKKTTITTEETTHHRTTFKAHGQTRPPAPATSASRSSSAPRQATPAPQAKKFAPNQFAPNQFVPTRIVHPDGVTIEDVDPAEFDVFKNKKYAPDAEYFREVDQEAFEAEEQPAQQPPQQTTPAPKPRHTWAEKGKERVSDSEDEDDEEAEADEASQPALHPLFEDKIPVGDISIETDGSSTDIGFDKTATGNITCHTKGEAVEAQAMNTRNVTETKKKGRLSRKKKVTKIHASGRAVVNRTRAQGHVTKSADAGLTLMGSEMKGKTITLKSKEGRINLLTALGYDFHSVKKESKHAAWQSLSQSTAYHEGRKYCRFETDDESGLVIEPADGLYVEFIVEQHSHTEANRSKPKTTAHKRLKDLPDAPGYEWLKAIDQRDDVIRVYVDEKHETSYTRQEGLSAAARLVLNIALNYVTCGSGGLFSIAFNNFVINSISCRGDFSRGAKQTFGKEGRKALARSFATKILMGDFKGSEGAGWVHDIKNAFLESMHETIGNYLAGGIVDRDWRIDARRLGINLAAGTAAKFGAKSIGDWRKDSILGSDNPFVDYVMHKALHGGLAAGVATATARMDHLKGTERQKHIVGAASGAMMAEVVSEYMMGSAIRRMEEKLTASGHAPSSQAYAALRRSLLADEFKTIRTVAQLSVAALAESLKVDLNAAMNAATNALDKNALPLLATVVITAGRAGKLAWDAYKVYRAAKTISDEIMSLEEFMAQQADDASESSSSSSTGGGSGGGMTPDEDPDDKGKKPVRDMTDDEYVQSLGNRADKRFGGNGPRIGTQKHRYAEKLHKRYQRMTGERRHMEAETRFARGEDWKPKDTTKGTSTPDMYNRKTGEAYDYKFGEAKMSSRQQQKYEANLPKVDGKNAPVHTMKPGSANG